MPDIDRDRAQNAYDAVISAKRDEKIKDDKFKTWAQKLPTLILNNGLLPAIAFLDSKKKEKAYEHVSSKCKDWLSLATGGALVIPWAANANPDVKRRLMAEDSSVYRCAEAEAIAWASWLKRFAESEIED